jgi:hypothetical protein
MAYFMQRNSLSQPFEKRNCERRKGETITSKVVFKFLQVNIEDEEIDSFVRKLEELLKKYSGNAYHFRYEVEQPFPSVTVKNHRVKSNGADKETKFKVT